MSFMHHEMTNTVKALSEKMALLVGIDSSKLYIPGLVTLTMDPAGLIGGRPFVIVAWKIDDPVWKVATEGRDRISEKDAYWHRGVYSFTFNSHSWAWGIEPFLDIEPARQLCDRIIRLTSEYGVDVEFYEAEVHSEDNSCE